MDCLVNLVRCKFLKNISKELSKARTALTKQTNQPVPVQGYKPAIRREAKKLYNYYMDQCGFSSILGDIDAEDKSITYYLQEGGIVWMASRIKDVIDQAKIDSITLNGDIPLYSGRQFIQNRVFYIVMYDLSFHVPAITTN